MTHDKKPSLRDGCFQEIVGYQDNGKQRTATGSDRLAVGTCQDSRYAIYLATANPRESTWSLV
ncbi:MAG: hypothetical protein VB855_08195 [Pirellulaceae bacterium]